jgi:hypothetical protein
MPSSSRPRLGEQERSLNPNSMDLFFRGRACWNKGFAPEYMTQARDFFERSLALDPNNIDAENLV